MKRIFSNIVEFFGFGLGLATFAVTFLAYFIIKVDPRDGTVYDGLNRQMTEAPQWARKLLGTSDYWAGLQWRVVDTLIFFGLLFVAWKIIQFSSELGRREEK
jgi:hypothetical protein